MARRGFFDPAATLRAVVEDAAAPRKLPAGLRETLKNLGRHIFGWLVLQLRAREVSNPRTEAQDLFQQFCIRVFTWIRGNGPDVSEPWFWTIAKNVYINHLQRELVNKRDAEQPLDCVAEDKAWLLGCLDGLVAVGQTDCWTEARIGALIRRCIARLPRRERQYILVDLVFRMPAAEIGRLMGLKPKSRAALKAKAVRDLRIEILEELGVEPEPQRPRRARTRGQPMKGGSRSS